MVGIAESGRAQQEWACIEIEAATVDVDGGMEVFLVAVATDHPLDLLDFGVEALVERVRDSMRRWVRAFFRRSFSVRATSITSESRL